MSSRNLQPIGENPKARVSVADYVTLERLIRERPSLATLEKSVQLFPTCSMFWITYLEFLGETPDKAVKVAERAVLNCAHVDLWKRYLGLAKSLYRFPDFFPIYSKAVSSIGNDYQSIDFWLEYTYFLRAVFNLQTLNQYSVEDPSKLPPNAFLLPLSTVLPSGITEDMLDIEGLKLVDERPSLASIREVFQNGLSVPMERIDSLWDEYQAFEQVVASAMNAMAQSIPVFPGMPPPPAALASIQATKMLSEYSNRWIQSKQGLREINRLYSAINLYFAPIPLDSATVYTLQPNILKWREILKHEKSNPLKLNFKRFSARIEFVLKQCLMVNVYVAEFWYELFIWKLSCSGFDEAVDVLKTAINEYLTSDITLRIVLALVYEETGRIADSKKYMSESLAYFDSIGVPAPAILIHFIRFCVRCLGAVHGRNAFLDALRLKSIHLSPAVIIAFAKLEWHSLQNSAGASKVLQIARDMYSNDLLFQKELGSLRSQIASCVAERLEKAPNVPTEWFERDSTDVHELVLRGFMASLRSGSHDVGDRVELDIEEDERKTGGVCRPEITRMQSYKPGMDFDEGPVDTLRNKTASKSGLPSSLRALVSVLPNCEGHVPDTDTVLRALQVMKLPAIAIASLKRFEEDIHIESLRREKDALAGPAVTSDGESLKRLIGEEKEDAMLMKADLLDDEKDQREFLSALAANIHRERINYKRHRLSAINAAAVASIGKIRVPTI